jgi:cytochrome b subunit of formate dehydrogenase
MMLAVIYHLGIVSYKLYVERIPPSMLPGVVDFRSFIETTKYFIGRKRNPAQQARYTFEEKIEYWAVVWGTVIMVVTGFMMWNPILTTNLLSGEVIPAAKIAHGAEAVLAVLAIIVWHLYHVLVKTLNKSMFNGHLNEVQMLHEHPLELADIKAGLAQRPVDPVERARRQKIFIPTYSVLGLAMLAGLYFFVSFETTAITTIPPAEENIVAFVPLTPTPLPTLQPTATPGTSAGAPTWENSIAGLFDSKCTSCHGTVAKLAELDLSTYESALVGGQSGPVIVPGDAAGSLLIQIQSAGGHPGQLTDEEIELVTQWINSGAPEE